MHEHRAGPRRFVSEHRGDVEGVDAAQRVPAGLEDLLCPSTADEVLPMFPVEEPQAQGVVVPAGAVGVAVAQQFHQPDPVLAL